MLLREKAPRPRRMEEVMSFVYSHCDTDFTLLTMSVLIGMEPVEAKSYLDYLISRGVLSKYEVGTETIYRFVQAKGAAV